MPTVQVRRNATSVTYRVEIQKDGRRSSKSFKTKKEAERYAALVAIDDQFKDTVLDTAKCILTVSEAVSLYLKQYRGKDPSVHQRLTWWAERFGNRKISKLVKRDVKAALDELEAQGLTPATINRRRSQLSALFTWLADEFDFSGNPAREVRQRKEDNGSTRFLSKDEAARLLSACRENRWDRLYLLVLMALTTGGRRSELLNLTWDKIDLARGRAYLAVTKNGSARQLKLTSDVIQELMRFRQIGGYVFVNEAISVRSPWRVFDRAWSEAKAAAGIDECRFHDLRHSCASWLAMSGAGLLDIASILGHKSITMTQRYSHLCDTHQHSTIQRVFEGVGVAV